MTNCSRHITVSCPLPSARSTSDINNKLNKPRLSLIIRGSPTTFICGIHMIEYSSIVALITRKIILRLKRKFQKTNIVGLLLQTSQKEILEFVANRFPALIELNIFAVWYYYCAFSKHSMKYLLIIEHFSICSKNS